MRTYSETHQSYLWQLRKAEDAACPTGFICIGVSPSFDHFQFSLRNVAMMNKIPQISNAPPKAGALECHHETQAQEK